ncbi:LysR substrate-binding domain-containing protein [Chitinasiproducens palmae]|nr:LysR substrate-binding domain-containing protein [Chitinasiproducens palmae]
MRFDLIDLKLFVAVVEAGSITHGAARCHLALASASARLRAIEDDLGTPLLLRKRNGVTPTAAGEALLNHARLMLRQLRDLHGELASHAGGAKGRVRLHANGAACTEHLPDALARFLAQRTDIDIDLREATSTAVVNAVAAGEADIGVVSNAVATGDLHCVPFAVDRLVAVVAADDPLAGASGVDFAVLLDRDYLGLPLDSALQIHLDEHALRLGRRFRHRIRVRTFESVCRMASLGGGIGIVPEAAARRIGTPLPIAIVPLRDAWASRQLKLCVATVDGLAPFTRALFTFLAEPATLPAVASSKQTTASASASPP